MMKLRMCEALLLHFLYFFVVRTSSGSYSCDMMFLSQQSCAFALSNICGWKGEWN